MWGPFPIRSGTSVDCEKIKKSFQKTKNNFQNKIRVDARTKARIGTTSPNRPLEIAGPGGANRIRIKRTDSTVPAAIIEAAGSDNSVGWNFGINALIGDAFEVNQGSTNRFAILNNGYVGIGTTGPGYKLDVAGTINASEIRVNGSVIGANSDWTVSGANIYRTSGNFGLGTTPDSTYRLTIQEPAGPIGWGTQLYLKQNNANHGWVMAVASIDGHLRFARIVDGATTIGMDITGSGLASYGTCVAGSCSSDIKLKKDIRPFNLGLDALEGIKPKYFKYKGLGEEQESKKPAIGVIAQDIEKSAPSLVTLKMVKLHPDDKKMTEIKAVNYSALLYVVINSVKELYNKWNHDSKDLHLQLSNLQKENNELQARLKSLEQKILSK